MRLAKILLVDDEPDITTALKTALERNGFKVDAYNDPTVALSKFRPGAYEVILLDIRMPKMNGFELYRELKRLDEGSKVCFLTAFDVYFDEFKRLFPNMDVQHFIRKPVGVRELVARLKEIMKSPHPQVKKAE